MEYVFWDAQMLGSTHFPKIEHRKPNTENKAISELQGGVLVSSNQYPVPSQSGYWTLVTGNSPGLNCLYPYCEIKPY